MTTHYTSNEINTFDQVRQQNDQYWKIIEKQRSIIQTLQKSLTTLTSENELLHKKNRELEKNMTDNTSSTPALPPRSPYRVNQPQDAKVISPEIPKRPPVLQLKKSNYRPSATVVKDIKNTAEILNKEYLISPGKSDPSSPMSSTSANSSFGGMDRPSFDSTPEQTSKQSTPRYRDLSPSQQYEQKNLSKSEPSTPIQPRTPRFDSLMTRNQYNEAPTVLSNHVSLQVISSSLAADEKGKEYPVFVIVLKDESDNEIWKIKKTLNDIYNLDVNLKQGNNITLKKLPEKTLFPSYTPVKMEERKTAVEEYLQYATTHLHSSVLRDFLSSDQVGDESHQVGPKQGYLTKRGKNFGGWKTRYFVLETAGVLNYYERQDGNLLGTIQLVNSHIRCQSAQEDYESSFRNAFLILEPKSNGSQQRHIFCASSEADRAAWVESLSFYAANNIMTSSISEDNIMMDQLVLEPSSSTESARTAPTVSHSSSTDYITTYFSQGAPTRRKSFSKEDDEARSKKSNHRASKRTFWGKKMFGSHSNASDITSPPGIAIGSIYDLNHIQAISDYEETRGHAQVFGIPLEDAVTVARVCEQYELPAIVHRCIEYMETKNALIEEGIYRLSGSAAEIKHLKKRFNNDGDVKLLEDKESHDVHAIAGLLKMWLRELPENIFTETLLGDFLKTMNETDRQAKISQLGTLISYLPLVNYTLLRSLCAHLIRVVENSDKNKMTLRNIIIVFSATLGIPSSIFNLMLIEFDSIFWTKRCDEESHTVPTTEDAIKSYMQDLTDDESSQFLAVNEENTRSKRNSTHYHQSTPKDFISLEKQLNAVIDDIPTPYDDEPYYSDEELEMAYFASRYTANSNTSSH